MNPKDKACMLFFFKPDTDALMSLVLLIFSTALTIYFTLRCMYKAKT